MRQHRAALSEVFAKLAANSRSQRGCDALFRLGTPNGKPWLTYVRAYHNIGWPFNHC